MDRGAYRFVTKKFCKPLIFVYASPHPKEKQTNFSKKDSHICAQSTLTLYTIL